MTAWTNPLGANGMSPGRLGPLEWKVLESLWARSNRLHLFVQKTRQNDGDDRPDPADTSPPTMASVLEIDD